MQIGFEEALLNKYPTAEIGYLIADVIVRPSDPLVESLKNELLEYLMGRGINATNFVIHPHLAVWRKIYKEDFGVKESTFRSSLEALVRRVVTGKGLWNICNVVDLYNCCSVFSLLPMGGYDLSKISGDIQIRFAKEGESFLGLGERMPLKPLPSQVVYADEARLICWLWNHKDAEETCIDETTKRVIFFIDSVDLPQSELMDEALKNLSERLNQIDGRPLEQGRINNKNPFVKI